MATPQMNQWQRRRRDINDQYGQRAALNEYARFISQQRANRGIRDYKQGFSRSLADTNRGIRGYKQEYARELPSHTASFGARGLNTGGVRSGVARQAMQQYSGDFREGLGDLNRSRQRSLVDYSRQLGELRGDRESENEQFQLRAAQLEQERARALAALEQQRAEEIARTAQNLQALRQFFGGR